MQICVCVCVCVCVCIYTVFKNNHLACLTNIRGILDRRSTLWDSLTVSKYQVYWPSWSELKMQNQRFQNRIFTKDPGCTSEVELLISICRSWVQSSSLSKQKREEEIGREKRKESPWTQGKDLKMCLNSPSYTHSLERFNWEILEELLSFTKHSSKELMVKK